MGGSIYDIALETLEGETRSMADYRGKVLLVVNTASKCGFTPQYAALQDLWERYGDRGFAVLGFPCNQFGDQEPGSAEDIGTFCTSRYGITFPMYAKVDVNGKDTHPLYRHLQKEKGGLLGTKIKWNFTKFLVDAEGKVVDRYSSVKKPRDIASAIERLLPPA